ncbi:uncharacterized protein LOC119442423 [Dermacentor silvarum]|nr:uncharacterized protein LOC119442423 [Dermacentor silvarum]
MLFFPYLVMLLLSMAAVSQQQECNGTFARPARPEDHPAFSDLERDQFESITNCPGEIDCCDDGTFSCYNWTYLTCSCREDCEEFGDCCWSCENKSVDVDRASLNTSKWTCTSLALEGGVTKHVFLASRCNSLWPLQDDVRDRCEDASFSPGDMFFRIPVTSRRSMVTYRNTFCAFCNYDLDEVIFWEVAVVGTRKKQKLRPPPFMSTNFYRYMRQCSRFPLIGDCPQETNSRVTRSCWAFFAPVIDEISGSAYYKNAYCARCHGVDLTGVSCLPAEKTTTTLRVEVKITISLPDLDLSSIFRTVDRNSTCFSSYNGVCYIKQVTYRYTNASAPNPNTATMIRGYLTIVCISVSLFCLVLKLVVYLMSKECRTFSSRCTLCLSMTLFFTQLFFLIFNVTDLGRDVCVASSVVVHFGFLSTAFWTTVLAYDIWKTLILVRRPSGNWKSLVRYAFAGWGSPLVVVGMASILNWTKSDSPLSPSYGTSRCFINRKWSHVVFFLTPMLVLLLVDIGFYLHTVFTIRRTESQSQKFDFKGNEKPSRILLFVKLAFIMGISWLLGLISGLVNSLLMDCVSIVFIGLQGVFLFFGFRDHRHVSQMVSSSSSLVTGLLSHSRSRSSTTATTDLALGNQIPTILGSSHDRRTSDDVASA